MLHTKPSIVLHVTSKKVTLASVSPDGKYDPSSVKTYSISSSLERYQVEDLVHEFNSLSVVTTLEGICSNDVAISEQVPVPVVVVGLTARGAIEFIQSSDRVLMYSPDSFKAVAQNVPGYAYLLKSFWVPKGYPTTPTVLYSKTLLGYVKYRNVTNSEMDNQVFCGYPDAGYLRGALFKVSNGVLVGTARGARTSVSKDRSTRPLASHRFALRVESSQFKDLYSTFYPTS